MNRLMLNTVFSGLTTACRLAVWPTNRSPVLANATTDGSKRLPSAVVMMTGSPPSKTATTLFVVPRSMPTILLILHLSISRQGWRELVLSTCLLSRVQNKTGASLSEYACIIGQSC